MQGLNTFIFHKDWGTSIMQMTDEQAGYVVKKLLVYAFTDEPIELGPTESIIMRPWIDRLERDIDRYISRGGLR